LPAGVRGPVECCELARLRELGLRGWGLGIGVGIGFIVIGFVIEGLGIGIACGRGGGRGDLWRLLEGVGI
jgi:hypothetical protein